MLQSLWLCECDVVKFVFRYPLPGGLAPTLTPTTTMARVVREPTDPTWSSYALKTTPREMGLPARPWATGATATPLLWTMT